MVCTGEDVALPRLLCVKHDVVLKGACKRVSGEENMLNMSKEEEMVTVETAKPLVSKDFLVLDHRERIFGRESAPTDDDGGGRIR